MNALKACDTLQFEKGVYRGPFELNNVAGELNNPIVILGLFENGKYETKIDGKSAPGNYRSNNAFRLKNCSWIVISGFSIENCWTDAIVAVETSYLSIDHCIIKGGKRALFTTGRDSHHFLMEHCTWEQDPRVWDHSDGYTWEELHHGKYKHFNGSLFQGKNISGDFVLRSNMIKNTFNAFRLSLVGNGIVDSLAGTNGDIYDNTIINTADNVLEPELYCHNLYFYHNKIINGHALISFTDVGGGYIYLYGNTGVSLTEKEEGWTIFKISKDIRSLSDPFYIFNNSWYVDFDIVGSNRHIWSNDEISHFNNAYFIENQDTFGIYRTGYNNSFNYDCSNLPFPKWFKQEGYEANGLVTSPLFVNPEEGNFKLSKDSPCIDRGMIDNKCIPVYEGKSPDIGAFEGDRLYFGKPFEYMKESKAVNFIEHPRISRYLEDGSHIKFWFTTPVSVESMKSCTFELIMKNSSQFITWHPELSDPYCFVFSLENTSLTKDFKLAISGSPKGVNGAKITSWASAVPLIFKEDPPLDN